MPRGYWSGLLSFETALMLSGLALENLLKAIIVSRDGASFSDDRLPKELDDHNLGRPLSRSRVDLSDFERHLAERLHHAVMWSGRYPIPKSPTQMKGVLVAVWDMKRNFAALFRRLRRLAIRRNRP
jgi:hypothetical protein